MSREQVLGRIRTALAAEAGQHEAPSSPPFVPATDTFSSADRLALFTSRLEEYGAGVWHVLQQDIAVSIANTAQRSGRQRLLAPEGLPSGWLDPGLKWIRDTALSYADIEAADGVVTGSTLAVADSGTILLTHGPSEGRRVLTLLPDYHLCVVRASQIELNLPAAFKRLSDRDISLLTFTSGPSATADIEMTRVKGVHGPRFLDVLLITDL